MNYLRSMKKETVKYILIFFMLAMQTISYAQCAMCKASAESSIANGGGIEKGINAGIIYLMGIPYFLCAMFCFVFRKDLARAYHNWRGTAPEAMNTIYKQYRFLFLFFGALSLLFLIAVYAQLKK